MSQNSDKRHLHISSSTAVHNEQNIMSTLIKTLDLHLEFKKN